VDKDTSEVNQDNVVNDPYEPNDVPLKAKVIYFNKEYLAKLDSGTDQDYYIFFLSHKVTYKMVLDNLCPNTKYGVELYGHTVDGCIEGTVDHTYDNKGTLTFKVGSKGTYLLKIYHISGRPGQYRLRLSLKQ
jgi:hypothetical protein